MREDRYDVELLLVEDNPDDLELTLLALRKTNLANKIHVARDGEEALDYLFARGAFEGRRGWTKPKLILLDLKLPKVNGIEVLRQLKGDRRTSTIPVVILTSSREERDVADGYDLGVNSYIQKPVDFDEFRATINQLGLYWLLTNVAPKSGVAGPQPAQSIR